MLYVERWKIILAMLFTVAGILYAVPNVLSESAQTWSKENLPHWLPTETVNLGLDLQGGSHLLYEADTEQAMKDRIQGMRDGARSELRRKKIAYTDLRIKKDGIVFKLKDLDEDRKAAYKAAGGLEENTIIDISGDGTVDVRLTEVAIRQITTEIINKSIEIVRRRVDESGTREPVIQRQGVNRIVVQLPGVDNPDEIKSLIGTTAKMSFHMLDENAVGNRAGARSLRLPLRGEEGQYVVIERRVRVQGDKLIDSQPSFDQNNQPVVSFRFNAQGAKQFCDVTKENVGKPFAIKLDSEVISAPVIRDKICGGRGQISGNFSVKEANDLSLLLRSGALPAPLKIVEERTVGPSLGSDSVSSGKKAAVYALLFVVIMMAAAYGLFGMFANVALILNLVFIFALLSVLQATLTLPGIAAIVLTIGIAVDANVLVYERIREELRQGRSVISAIDTGYRIAKDTIVDANVTTLIVSLILFSFGTGPVKGFAVAMSIGIITTLFSALVLTRLMVIAWLRQIRPTELNL